MNTDLGRSILDLARWTVVDEVFGCSEPEPDRHQSMMDHRGVFVTLNKLPGRTLRGCIGYPYPVMPLGDALCGAARSACHDPRFPDLSVDELQSITIDVTVLTVPMETTPDQVILGRDGLILDWRGYRGLLLPQVPLEQGWDLREYLEGLSMKTGLPPNAWSWDDSRLYSFQGTIYSE